MRHYQTRFFQTGFFAATLVASTGLLVAQEEGDLFARLDANKDGIVSSDEVPADQQTLFERLLRNADIDGDKKLTQGEFQAGLKPDDAAKQPLGGGGPPGRPGGFGGAGARPDPRRAEELFDRSDANNDGKLTKEEIPEDRRAGFKQMMERLRLNPDGDGSVTKEQFVRVMMFMEQRDGSQPPGGPPGPGRPPQGQGPPGGPPGFPRPPVMVIDANQDGELSKDEIEGAAKALLTLDKNGDGKVSRDELFPAGGPGGMPGRPGPPGSPPPPGARPSDGPPGAQAFRERMKQADADGDGKLSKEEAPDRLKENFARLDANSDGFLDETETQRMFQRMQAGDGKGPKGKRPKGSPDNN